MDKFQPGDLVETPNGRGKVIYMTYLEPCGAVNREMDAVLVKFKNGRGTNLSGITTTRIHWAGAHDTVVIYPLEQVQPAIGLPGI